MLGRSRRCPHIMGILNVTPDSFSDGGRFFSLEAAEGEALNLERQGASIIDIGGESTRPGAQAVSAEEERERVIPLINALKKKLSIPLSIDTTKATVAARALERGASILNDISGLTEDPEMPAVVKHYKPTVVLMHRKGNSSTMKGLSSTLDEIREDLKHKAQNALSFGLSKEQIILDPGLGFGKTVADNWNILKNLNVFQSLGFPLLIGASRKSFLGDLVGGEPHERDAATLAVTALCFEKNIEYVRVHNVLMTHRFLSVLEKTKGY